MSLTQLALRYIRKKFTRKKVRHVVLGHLPNVVNVGPRAVCKRISFHGKPCLKKTFLDTPVGRACFERELAAQDVFGGRPWMAPVIKKGPCWLIVPWYPEEDRLDRLAGALNRNDRATIAAQAVEILFEMFLRGYAHRDFHARNLFFVNDQLIVIDFEVLGAYPPDRRPAFPVSYDLVGRGLESPFETKQMCYNAEDGEKASLKQVLGIPSEGVLEKMAEDLKEELRIASTTFKTKRERHTCRAERIYSSFDLPHLAVTNREAQRDSARRFANFGMNDESLRNKTILDLGSNIGGMLFEAQRFQPGRCLGIEYDQDKVELAARVAAYNGLTSVSFQHANIDRLTAHELGEPFDVVFCLAIESHVKRLNHLYALLAQVTCETVYFEGNASTDPADAEARLLRAGFATVEHLGLSDDDCLASNNCRSLLVARK